MIIIQKKNSPVIDDAAIFVQKMKKKYGSTYFIDMSKSEKLVMQELNEKIKFDMIAADGATFDR